MISKIRAVHLSHDRLPTSGVLHSYNQFHAAGHGTFFSGILSSDGDHPDEFLWVYDCGSKKPTRLPELVEDLSVHADLPRVDMLCISHFDADHINGLDALLKKFKVGALVLPYLPLSARLRAACNVISNEEVAAGVPPFILDPIGFIRTRYPEASIGEFVMVRGGRRRPPSPPEEEAPPRERAPDDDGERPREERPGSRLFGDLAMQADENLLDSGMIPGAHRAYGRIFEVDHADPLKILGGFWEFTLFNKTPPAGRAPKSRVGLEVVRKDVAGVLAKHWPSLSQAPQPGWEKALRTCYEKHFGNSATGRNDISLCLMSRPTIARPGQQCSLYASPVSKTNCAHALIPMEPQDRRLGLLLTGDIKLDKTTATAMQKHFGALRWCGVRVMQVPHHGSRGSWHKGLAAGCNHSYSVFCVPDSSAQQHHPSPLVLADFAGKNPLFANYSLSVVYSFHIDH